jgi:hypothetical protein
MGPGGVGTPILGREAQGMLMRIFDFYKRVKRGYGREDI